MSAVQPLIERGVPLKPKLENSTERFLSSSYFPLQRAISAVNLAESTLKLVELKLKSFSQTTIFCIRICLFVSVILAIVKNENASRQLEIVKLLLKNWTGDLDSANEYRHTPM